MIIENGALLEFEIRDIVDYYNNNQDNPGREFLHVYDQTVNDIVFMPERWPVIEADLRQALLPKFPYLIYYRVLSENHIRILGVKHQKRDPQLGRSRE